MGRFTRNISGTRKHGTRRGTGDRPALECLETRTLFSTFVVRTDLDNVTGSLREAILRSNSAPGPDLIQFDLPAGRTTIQPLSPLPRITDPVIVDGFSQPGASGAPLVRLDGAKAGIGGSGLDVAAPGSKVTGLAITSWTDAGILLREGSDGSTVVMNMIGTTENFAAGNFNGIVVQSSNNNIGFRGGNTISGNSNVGALVQWGTGNLVSDNTIGLLPFTSLPAPNGVGVAVDNALDTSIGVPPGQAGGGNVIAGNTWHGVEIYGGVFGTRVRGNLIGTDHTGTSIGNGADGIRVDWARDAALVIGGTNPEEANVISGNAGDGVRLFDSSAIRIEGNRIGTDSTGTRSADHTGASLGNRGAGVRVENFSEHNLVGGTFGAGNVIGNNNQAGVMLVDAGADNQVVGNSIGISANRSAPLPNGGDGVFVANTSDTLIGQGDAAADNVIAYNAGNGVRVVSGRGNEIRGNSIGRNGLLGIDLSHPDLPPGLVNPNDGYGHFGANDYRNYPLIASAVREGDMVRLRGVLADAPATPFRLHFYANIDADPSGHGEGMHHLGTAEVDTNGSGRAEFDVTLAAPAWAGDHISATATSAPNFFGRYGSTSEFSPTVIAEIVIPKADSSTSIFSEAGQYLYAGAPATFHVGVAGNFPAAAPAGEVLFSHVTIFGVQTPLGSATLQPGGLTGATVTFVTDALPLGPGYVEARFAGDANHHPSANATFVRVQPDATTSTLAASASPARLGEPWTLTVTVDAARSDNDPIGSAGFDAYSPELGYVHLGIAPLVNGVAQLSVTSLPPGTYDISAGYLGEPGVPPPESRWSQSGAFISGHQVDRAQTTATVSSPEPTVAYGAPLVVGVDVTSAADNLPPLPTGWPTVPRPTGEVTFMAGDAVLGSAMIYDGRGGAHVMDPSLLLPGERQVVAVYAGDAYHAPTTSEPFTITVLAPETRSWMYVEPQTPVFGEMVTISARVEALSYLPGPGAPLPGGTMTYRLGETVLGIAPVVDGISQYQTTSLPVGQSLIDVEYSGDAVYRGHLSGFAVWQQADSTTTSLAVSPDTAVMGQEVVLRATVRGDHAALPPTGDVEFVAYDAAQERYFSWYARLEDGVARVAATDLPAGTYEAFARYRGDWQVPWDQTQFQESFSAPVTFAVARATPAVTAGAFPSDIIWGGQLGLGAQVFAAGPSLPSPTGEVWFMEGDAVVAVGFLTFDGRAGADFYGREPLSVGVHHLRAVFPGDAFYERAESEPFTVAVAPLSTRVHAVVEAERPVFGEPLAVNVFVAPDGPRSEGAPEPGGTVTVRAGDVVLGSAPVVNGQASLTVTDLPAGEHLLTADYAGDAIYGTALGGGFVRVYAAETTTVVTSSPAATFGDSVVVTATVAPLAPGGGTPQGAVGFWDGDQFLGEVQLADGVARLTAAPLAAGSHEFRARYVGGANHVESVATPLTLAVSPAATSLAVSADSAASVYGQRVRFTAVVADAVAGANPGGMVTFYDGETALGTVALDGAGVAVLEVSGLAVGAHFITAAYAGDANFVGSTSTAVSHPVERAVTVTTLSSSATPSVVETQVVFTAAISVAAPSVGTPGGVVTFMDGATVLGAAAIVNGVATYATSALALGAHEIRAVYGGGENFAGSTSAALTQSVDYPAGTTVARDQTGNMDYWASGRGQGLIRKFDGSSASTELGNWLARSYPRLFGPSAGNGHNLAGLPNTAVADHYRAHATGGGLRLRAQMMALALNVYATTNSLGGPEGATHGFAVSRWGVLVATWNVGGNGEPFGVADDTVLPVHRILSQTDAMAAGGQLFGGNPTLQSEAYLVFDAVNRAGGI